MISDKYKYYISQDKYRFEFLEGATASGKTTVAISWKFVPQVLKSNKKLHVILGKTSGVIEKNIIQQDNGLLYYWGNVFSYNGNGSKDYKFPHLIGKDGLGREKIILCIGYDNNVSWKNLLGGQYGCIFIDEINTANIETVREVSSRCDNLIGTLNPDNPDLDVYSEYINKAVIDERYKGDVPEQIRGYMTGDRESWGYFFFTMDDNISLSDEDKRRKRESLDPSTKIYKNKILGLRCRSVGLVFPSFERALIDSESVSGEFEKLVVGVDTSYSSKTEDMVALVLSGLSEGVWYVLRTWGFNNKDRVQSGADAYSPSDVAELVSNRVSEWNSVGFGRVSEIYVDSADAGTIAELRKLKKYGGRGSNSRGSNSGGGLVGVQIVEAYKGVKIIDRINLMNGWIWNGALRIVRGECKELERELGVYSWSEKDSVPMDKDDHFVNACQYGFIPYIYKIGV